MDRSGRRKIQAVVNLIFNAAEFSPCGITMRVRPHDSHLPDGGEALYCFVSDNGASIPGNGLKAVFGLFVQSRVAKTNAGGTAPRLAIGRPMVEAYGVRILGGAPKALQMPLSFAIPGRGAPQAS
jgi:signal transduction histidine kinase